MAFKFFQAEGGYVRKILGLGAAFVAVCVLAALMDVGKIFQASWAKFRENEKKYHLRHQRWQKGEWYES